MKKQVSYFMLFGVLVILFGSCQKKEDAPPAYKHQLLLINPTQGNLTSILSMMEEGIIDLPATELISVHYARTEYRYSSIERFLENNAFPQVRLIKIDGDLNEENIFRENTCSTTFDSLFENSDGALFFGGADFPPIVYGEKTHLLTSIRTPSRHFFELSFLFHLLGGSQDPEFNALLEKNPGYVIRGFCLGMQTINVATGGTMYQDIPSEVYDVKYVEDVLELDQDDIHRNYWNQLAPREDLIWCNFHRIRFIEEEFFTSVMDLDPLFTPYVCSSHHQAADMLGKDLRIAATSMDGKIIEAISHEGFPNVLGVQFHPEAFSIYNEHADKHKRAPGDTILLSEYDFLSQDQSLQFHIEFWQQFSKAVKEMPEGQQ